MSTNKTILEMACLLACGAAVAPAAAQEEENPYLLPDETWISISGTAAETTSDAFALDYGDGIVTVEMDEDWSWYDEQFEAIEGDRVTVYGEIDDDLYETTTIEASSVSVESMGTYFYASAEDDYMDAYDYWFDYDPIVVGDLTVRGTVTEVDGREFNIDTGVRELEVDTDEMLYNPMDNIGYQQIDVGDYVSVSGHMEEEFWDDRELEAESVVTLDDD